MESEKIKTDIDGYNTRPLLSGRVFCTCGNAGWRKKAGMASGFVPAEMGDGVEMHVRRGDSYLRKWGMVWKCMYGEGIRTCGNGGWCGNACTAAGDAGGTTRKRGIGGKRR